MRQAIQKMNQLQESSHYWLLGRRIALGYTLNSGVGLRNQCLYFRYEGQLLEKNKSQSISITSRDSGNKRNKKFAAANLLFECSNGPRVFFLFILLHFSPFLLLLFFLLLIF